MFVKSRLAIVMLSMFASSEAAADDNVFRIAFGSCAEQDQPQPIWDAIVDCNPDVFLFIGDTVYADTTDPVQLKQAFDTFGRIAGFQRLKKTCPVYAIWDDHDYGINDGGAEHPRKQAAQQVFLDFFEVPDDALLRRQEGIHQAYVFGSAPRRIQVIMLDTRYHRGPLRSLGFGDKQIYLPGNNPSVTMLGDVQWQWLQKQLRIPAEIRFIVSGIQVIPDAHPFERWGTLPHERSRLFNEIAQSGANGVILLSGDQHFAEFSRWNRPDSYDLIEFTSSGLTHTRGSIPAPNNHRIGKSVVALNFGVIEIDWQPADPTITMTARSDRGTTLLEHELNLNMLQNASDVPPQTSESTQKPCP